MSRLSFLGLYKFDETLFDNLHLPSGMDKENIIKNILLESAELEVIYPDADIMKLAIDCWSQSQLHEWEKLYATTLLEYDPISNYDRKEEWTETTTSNTNVTATSNSESESNGTTSGNAEGKTSQVPFNTTEFKDLTKTVSTNAGTSNETNSGNSTENTSGTGESAITHSSRVHGNIGVTTTQQMIQSEREIVKFCMDDYIKDAVINRFCILVY